MARRGVPPPTECELLDRMLASSIEETFRSLGTFVVNSQRRVLTLLHTDARARTADYFDTLMLEFLPSFGDVMVNAPALSVEPFEPKREEPAERDMICYRVRVEQPVGGLLAWYNLYQVAEGCRLLMGKRAAGPVPGPLGPGSAVEVRRDAPPAVDPAIWDRIATVARIIYEDIEYLRKLESQRAAMSRTLPRWQLIHDVVTDEANSQTAAKLITLARALVELDMPLEFLEADRFEHEPVVKEEGGGETEPYKRRYERMESEAEAARQGAIATGRERDGTAVAGATVGAQREFDGAPILQTENIASVGEDGVARDYPWLVAEPRLLEPAEYLADMRQRAERLGEQYAFLDPLNRAENEYVELLVRSGRVARMLTVSFQHLVDLMSHLLDSALRPLTDGRRLIPDTPFGSRAEPEASLLVSCAENDANEAAEREALRGVFRAVRRGDWRGSVLEAFAVDNDGALFAGSGDEAVFLGADQTVLGHRRLEPPGRPVAAVALSGALARAPGAGVAEYTLQSAGIEGTPAAASPFVFQLARGQLATFGSMLVYPDGTTTEAPTPEGLGAPWGLLLLASPRAAYLAIHRVSEEQIGLVQRPLGSDDMEAAITVDVPNGAVGPDPARWRSRVRVFSDRRQAYLSIDRLLIAIDFAAPAVSVQSFELRDAHGWDARDRALVYVAPSGDVHFYSGTSARDAPTATVHAPEGGRADGVGVLDCFAFVAWLRTADGVWRHETMYVHEDGHVASTSAPGPPLDRDARLLALRPGRKYLAEAPDGSHAVLALAAAPAPEGAGRRGPQPKREREPGPEGVGEAEEAEEAGEAGAGEAEAGAGAGGAAAPLKRERRGGEEVD